MKRVLASGRPLLGRDADLTCCLREEGCHSGGSRGCGGFPSPRGQDEEEEQMPAPGGGRGPHRVRVLTPAALCSLQVSCPGSEQSPHLSALDRGGGSSSACGGDSLAWAAATGRQRDGVSVLPMANSWASEARLGPWLCHLELEASGFLGWILHQQAGSGCASPVSTSHGCFPQQGSLGDWSSQTPGEKLRAWSSVRC